MRLEIAETVTIIMAAALVVGLLTDIIT